MNAYIKASITALCLLIVMSGCLGLAKPPNKVSYYTLEYESPHVADGVTLDCAVRIHRFGVAPAYNSAKIIFRDASFKRDAYAYHKWRAFPGDLISHFLTRDMRAAGLFTAVVPWESRVPTQFLMEGSVDEFFEWDTDEGWKAVLSVTVTLIKEKEPDVSKKIKFQKSYRVRESCALRTPQEVAAGMSRAMRKISEQIIRDVYDSLKEEK